MPRPRRRAYNLAAAALVAWLAGGLWHRRRARRPHPSPRQRAHAPRRARASRAGGRGAGVGRRRLGRRDAAAGRASRTSSSTCCSRARAATALGELTRAIEAGGGEINAWTAFDHTVYHAVLGRDHVDGAIDALGDALIAPRVDPDELAREREVILEEIRQGTDDPARTRRAEPVRDRVRRAPVSPPGDRHRRERRAARRARAGRVLPQLLRRRQPDARRRRRCRSGSACERSVERRFRAMPAGRPGAARRDRAGADRAARELHACATSARRTSSVGFHVPSARHPDLAALDVAAILLGQSESARLPRLLRDRDQLATSAYANVHALRDPGLLVLSATARARRRATPRSARSSITASRSPTTLTSDELDKARIAAETAFVRQLETAQGRARSLGWHATVAGDPQFGHVYLDRIRAVRRHDVAAVDAALPAARQRERRGDPARRAASRRDGRSRASAEKRVATRARAARRRRRRPAEKRVVLRERHGAARPPRSVGAGRRDARGVARRPARRGRRRTAGASTLLARHDHARLRQARCGRRSPIAIDRLGGSLGGVAGRNSFGVAAEWLARSWKPGLDLLADCILDADAAVRRARCASAACCSTIRPRRATARRRSRSGCSARRSTATIPYARDVLGTPRRRSATSTRAALAAFYRERYPIVGADARDRRRRRDRRGRRRGQGAVRRRAEGEGRARRPCAPPSFDGRIERRARGLSLPRARAGAPRGRVPGRHASTRRIGSRSRCSSRSSAGRAAGCSPSCARSRRSSYRVSAHSVEGVDPGLRRGLPVVRARQAATPRSRPCAPSSSACATDGVTAAELERARSYLIGSHQIAMQRRAAVANAMAYHEAYGLGWQTLGALRRRDPRGRRRRGRRCRGEPTCARIATITATVRPAVGDARPRSKRSKVPPAKPARAPARPKPSPAAQQRMSRRPRTRHRDRPRRSRREPRADLPAAPRVRDRRAVRRPRQRRRRRHARAVRDARQPRGLPARPRR